MQEPLKKVNAYDDIKFDYSDEDEDEDLIRLAEERIKNHSGIKYTWEEFKSMHGIKEEDLKGWEEVEFE